MESNENIFHRVSKGNEDSSTELIVNLMQIKYIRDIILEFMGIEPDIYKEINSNCITTQCSIENIGRPDIVISNNECLIYIENKIRSNTTLQDSQTTTYVDKLIASKQKLRKLIFLIPENYTHRQEIDEIQNPDYRIMVTWENLLTELYNRQIQKWNHVVEHALSHLSEIILQKDIEIKLTIEEVALMMNGKDLKVANGLFLKIRALIEKIDSEIINKLGSDYGASDWSWGDNENEMGKYIRCRDKTDIFYGFNFQLLSQYPDRNDFLFGVAIHENIINKASLKENDDKCLKIEDDGKTFIIIFL